LCGIINVNLNGLMWKDAPAVYGRSKTNYCHWMRWCRMGVSACVMIELVD
jgi:hypothetical protein